MVERSTEEGCNLTHEGNINPSQEKSVAGSCFTLQGEVNGNGSSIRKTLDFWFKELERRWGLIQVEENISMCACVGRREGIQL